MYTKILVAIAAIATLALMGCDNRHYVRQQPVVYAPTAGVVVPCAPGSVAVGRNPNGSFVCQLQNNNGCVQTVYGSHCGGPNYRYQSPAIPPRMPRMSTDGGENDTDVPMIIET